MSDEGGDAYSAHMILEIVTCVFCSRLDVLAEVWYFSYYLIFESVTYSVVLQGHIAVDENFGFGSGLG